MTPEFEQRGTNVVGGLRQVTMSPQGLNSKTRGGLIDHKKATWIDQDSRKISGALSGPASSLILSLRNSVLVQERVEVDHTRRREHVGVNDGDSHSHRRKPPLPLGHQPVSRDHEDGQSREELGEGSRSSTRGPRADNVASFDNINIQNNAIDGLNAQPHQTAPREDGGHEEETPWQSAYAVMATAEEHNQRAVMKDRQ